MVVATFATEAERLDLTASDFADAAIVDLSGSAGFAFRLSERADADFAGLTERSIGEVLVFSVCDKPLVQVVVQERLSGRGQVVVADQTNAARYAGVLNGEISC